VVIGWFYPRKVVKVCEENEDRFCVIKEGTVKFILKKKFGHINREIKKISLLYVFISKNNIF